MAWLLFNGWNFELYFPCRNKNLVPVLVVCEMISDKRDNFVMKNIKHASYRAQSEYPLSVQIMGGNKMLVEAAKYVTENRSGDYRINGSPCKQSH